MSVLLGVLPPLAIAQGFVVDGRVVDAQSGTPLVRATVSLEADDRFESEPPEYPENTFRDYDRHRFGYERPSAPLASTITGAGGTFRLTGIPAGRYQLLAARRGYLSAALGQHGSFFTTVVVGHGSAGAENIRFPLLPLSRIQGMVRDSTGDPVQGGRITLFMQSFDGSGAVRELRSANVDRGTSAYSFDALPPGTYYVAVNARPWYAEDTPEPDGVRNPLDVVYPTTFWDSATASENAQPIHLLAGEAAEADFSLQAVPAAHVQVPLNGRGGGFPQLSVSAFGASLPAGWGNTMHRQEGVTTVTTSVAPGSYVLRRGSDATPVDASGDTVISSSQSAEGPVPLTGELAMADGSALPPGIHLLLAPEEEDERTAPLRFRGGGFEGPGFGHRTIELTPGRSGVFQDNEVVPGNYRLRLDGPAHMEVVAAAAQGGRVSSSLILYVGSAPVMLAATISAATGTVSGSARGAADAMILLMPTNQAAATLYRQTEAATDGSWTIENVVPGNYCVVAIRDGWDLTWRQTSVMARYMAAAEQVTVKPQGVSMTLAPLNVQNR